MRRLLVKLIRDEGGATAIEYGLIAVLISLVVIAAVSSTGKIMWNTMSNISSSLNH